MIDMDFLHGKRVALLTNIPRPYRLPLYACLNRHIRTFGGEFRVFYYSNLNQHAQRRGSYTVESDFPAEFILGHAISLGTEHMLNLPRGMGSQLRRFAPHALICGSFGLPGYLAWFHCLKNHCSYIQWSGAWEGGVSPARGRLYRLHQGFLARHASACVTYGSRASRYLASLGVPAERIITGVNTVEQAWFREESKVQAHREAETRLQRGWQGLNLLFVGGLQERKGVFQLLEAFARLPAEPATFLHFVGSGPSEEELQRRVETFGLQNRVVFWGRQPPQELPFFYALADLFIFPSLVEPWGLVLNEAMACGLPVIASSLAGATPDLVQDGVDGLVVDPRDVSALKEAIARLCSDASLRQRMGLAAQDTIAQHATIEHSAQAFLRALKISETSEVSKTSEVL